MIQLDFGSKSRQVESRLTIPILNDAGLVRRASNPRNSLHSNFSLPACHLPLDLRSECAPILSDHPRQICLDLHSPSLTSTKTQTFTMADNVETTP